MGSSDVAHVSRRTAHRALALALGLALGLALFIGLRGIAGRGRGERQSLSEVVDGRAALRALLERRAQSGAAPAERPADLMREPIPEEDARALFTQLRPKRRTAARYHPLTYFELLPGVEHYIPFPLHPGGGFYVRTNSAGLREDAEVLAEPPALRVVVAGDSHTEGACANPLSFPNRLEARLGERHPGRAIEVLNCGRSGYTFHNYLGVLEKYLPYEPDAFVMAVYGGNDFVEALPIHHYFHRTIPPDCGVCSAKRKLVLESASGNALLQGLRQVQYFTDHPEERERALEAACGVTSEVRRICAESGIRLVCLYIPTVFDTQPEKFQRFETEQTLLEVTDADLRINEEVADRWIEHARSLGIALVDLRDGFREAQEPYYWPVDLHLNLRGNEAVAEALLPLLDDLVP